MFLKQLGRRLAENSGMPTLADVRACRFEQSRLRDVVKAREPLFATEGERALFCQAMSAFDDTEPGTSFVVPREDVASVTPALMAALSRSFRNREFAFTFHHQRDEYVLTVGERSSVQLQPPYNKMRAGDVMLAHVHPSGIAEFSDADVAMLERTKQPWSTLVVLQSPPAGFVSLPVGERGVVGRLGPNQPIVEAHRAPTSWAMTPLNKERCQRSRACVDAFTPAPAR